MFTTNDEIAEWITFEGILITVTQFKHKKTSGIKGINTELIKQAPLPLTIRLLNWSNVSGKLVMYVTNGGAIAITVFKKGKWDECSNYY